MQKNTFPKKNRLRHGSEFDAVFRAKNFAADDTLVLHAIKNELEISRLGLSIGRKVGNAVERNRWKRRIREAFRQQQHERPLGLDMVVRPRKGASCDYERIFRSLNNLIKRIAKKVG